NVLVRLQTSLDSVERRQMAALSSVEDSMESRVRRMRGVFTDLGLDMAQLEAATPRSGVGGPFVPVKLAAEAGAFERQLYRINVKVGDTIKIGQVIGAVGSTGRSTGPHLHYETRIDGDAVDPQKFLRAGVRLSAG